MIDIRKLRYFATVAEFGSFTRAAEFLGVAQPALSRQVQQLEQEFGLELLLRRSRQVHLTDAGEVLLRHALTINRDFERLIDDMQVRKESPTGRVVVGITPTLAETLVPALAERVSQEFPRLSLKIAEAVTPVLADWVLGNKVDLDESTVGLDELGDSIDREVLPISAATGKGLDKLTERLWTMIQTVKAPKLKEPSVTLPTPPHKRRDR